ATITGVVHKLTERRNELLKSGRHMSYTEEKYLRRGRDLLDSEFSIALGIPQDEVASFIRKSMTRK
ncbi:MAG: hypothetical protein IJ708_06815, partial [Clostridia bacterium]|nr:hypothetical protein [Clostridia bacterium]